MVGAQDRVIFADMLRGIACLAVVLSHYGAAFWTPGRVISQIANVDQIPASVISPVSYYLLTSTVTFNLAACGVALFFLISGFVIPASIERTTVGQFAWGRLWRIVPTYAAGFTITLIALLIASAVYSRPFPYSWAAVASHYIPGSRFVAGSPFIDFIVWTLEIEVAFYILIAALARYIRSTSPTVFLLPVGLLIASLSQNIVSAPYTQGLAFMFVGVALHFQMRNRAPFLAALIAAVLLASCISAMLWVQGPIVATSYGAAAGVFIACYVARSWVPVIPPLRLAAAISYPLYVMHGIMGYVMMRILLDYAIPPGVAIICAFTLSVAISAALHVFVEVPTQRIGKLGVIWSLIWPTSSVELPPRAAS